MADISKIKIESGVYNIKDEVAREKLIPLTINRKFLLIGDSYGTGYTPEGNVTSWCQLFKNHFTNTIIKAENGYGFARPNYQFYDLINSIDNDETITDVIIMGGYNDLSFQDEVEAGIKRCITLIHEKFINVKNIFIAMCSYSNNNQQSFNFYNLAIHYRNGALLNNAKFIENIQFVLHNTSRLMSSDGFHPNQKGQRYLGNNLISFINNKSLTINYFSDLTLTFTNDFSLYNRTDKENVTISDLSNQLCNENYYLYLKRYLRLSVLNSELTFTCQPTSFYKIGDLKDCFITGDLHGVNRIACSLLINNHGTYKSCNGFLSIFGNELYITIVALNDAGNNYLQTKLSDIQIIPFVASLSSAIN